MGDDVTWSFKSGEKIYKSHGERIVDLGAIVACGVTLIAYILGVSNRVGCL
jgi:hypothetical protein